MNSLRGDFARKLCLAFLTLLQEGREGGLPIPFPSHHFFPNPTNQCPDPTDMLTKHQSHSHFSFFFLSQIPVLASDRNPIFPMQKQANPSSHFTTSRPSFKFKRFRPGSVQTRVTNFPAFHTNASFSTN